MAERKGGIAQNTNVVTLRMKMNGKRSSGREKNR